MAEMAGERSREDEIRAVEEIHRAEIAKLRPPIELAREAGFDSVEDYIADIKAESIEPEKLDEILVNGIIRDEESRRKPGRPRNQNEMGRVTIYKTVLDHAAYVASSRGIALSRYLSETLAPIVYGDFGRELFARSWSRESVKAPR